ncbi:MAG: tetratricopeptide repeat protein [Nannocystaceae bacterium]|nr:tetratricopeptide repeat protein [Nannocystaceae bacterium]
MDDLHSKASSRSRLVAVTLGLCLSLGAAPASAMGPADANEEQAMKLFADGEYEQAIAMFVSLFEETGTANYLYNIARIYEEDGNLAEAAKYYDKFVHTRGAELEMRSKASERAASIRKILRGDEGPDESVAPEPETGGEDSMGPATEPRDEPVEPSGRQGPSKVAISGYVLLGIGGVALIAGGVVGGLALSDNNKLSDENVSDPLALQTGGKRKALAADGLLIGGGVIAATGLTLVLVDLFGKRRAQSTRAQRHEFRLTGGAGLFGLGLAGRI